MRTLKQAYELLKEEDPDTGITMKEIRRIVENDEIEVYCVGRKKLINVDLLFAKLISYTHIPLKRRIYAVDTLQSKFTTGNMSCS